MLKLLAMVLTAKLNLETTKKQLAEPQPVTWNQTRGGFFVVTPRKVAKLHSCYISDIWIGRVLDMFRY